MLRFSICDSNKENLETLYTMLFDALTANKTPFLITKYDNYKEALNHCDNHVVYDIIFIAVDGEGSEGMKLARYIRTYDSHCKIVITSAVKDYAYASYGIRAFNYILQPYNAQEVKALADELCHIFQKIDARYITLNSKFGYYRIKHKDIVYVESLKRQVFFHCKDGSVI